MGFVALKPGSRLKTFGGKSKTLVMQRKCVLLWSRQSSNNKLTLTENSARCGMATMLRKTYGYSDSPTDRWKRWQKLSVAYQLWFSYIGPHKKFGIWRGLIKKINA